MAGGKSPRQQVTVTAVGRLSQEPGPVNAAGKLTKSSLAVNQRVKVNGEWADGPTMWFDLNTAGPQLVDLHKGDLVEVTGRLAMRTWQDREGATRYSYTIWVDKAANVAIPSEDSEFPVGA